MTGPIWKCWGFKAIRNRFEVWSAWGNKSAWLHIHECLLPTYIDRGGRSTEVISPKTIQEFNWRACDSLTTTVVLSDNYFLYKSRSKYWIYRIFSWNNYLLGFLNIKILFFNPNRDRLKVNKLHVIFSHSGCCLLCIWLPPQTVVFLLMLAIEVKMFLEVCMIS